MKKIFIAALLTCIPLALASCGEQNDDIPVPPETTDDGGIYDEYMTADDLVGDWSSWDGDNGSQDRIRLCKQRIHISHMVRQDRHRSPLRQP